MDINDVYYDKYIKYKTKYLELKEQSGNGLIRKIFNPNLELYGYNYNLLDQCIIKTEVIKNIIEVKGIEYIRKIMDHPNKNRILQSNNPDGKYIVDEETRKIIKNSKIEKLSKKSNKNLNDLRVNDIDNVLNEINNVLFEVILPDLYYKFEKKLEGKIEFTIELEKRYQKFGQSEKDLDKEIIEILRKEIETQINVKVKNENKKNIDNIVKVYNNFGNIIKKYKNNEYDNENIEKETKTEKDNLLIILNDIQPKVSMLIKIVELYFDFLKIYIINDIKRIMNDIYIYENNFISKINESINKKKLFLYKVYEIKYYGNDTLVKLNTFSSTIKNIIISEANIETTKNNLIEILEGLKYNSDYNQNIIDNINSNYNSIINKLDNNNINNNYNPSMWYKYYEYYESTRWWEYYNINKNLFKIDNIPLLLKKSINIYLYKMFIYKEQKRRTTITT
jgi:hypothetical protein